MHLYFPHARVPGGEEPSRARESLHGSITRFIFMVTFALIASLRVRVPENPSGPAHGSRASAPRLGLGCNQHRDDLQLRKDE